MISLASAVADLIEVVVRSGVRFGPHRLTSATVAPTRVRLNVGFTPLGVGGVEAVPCFQPSPDLLNGPNPARDNVVGSGADIHDMPMPVLLGCTDNLISSHIRPLPESWLDAASVQSANAPHLVALVQAGATVIDGPLQGRSDTKIGDVAA